jgi:acyl-coenzyme A synthetase/AMP-(fatty) acid ligase
MQKEFQLMHQDVVLQKTPFVFDVSVWEFFWPLFTGAKLVIAAPDVHKDPIALAQLIEKEKVSVAHFVPSMLSVFISSEQSLQNDCSSLRLLFSSGEMLPYKTKQQCLEHLPTAQLYNLYGPTEAAIDVSYWHCQLSDDFMSVPIGKPIANIQLYIVDGYSRPVPVGVTGELCIGGIGVARGYLNQPELTGEKFIENPFGEGRLYRTGDRARYLPDSNIEFLGRLDNQIKIRGYRIELSEIEAALLSHSDINHAVVMFQDIGAQQFLVAYIVYKEDEKNKFSIDGRMISETIKKYLEELLPNYMIPQTYIKLNELPLTSNGKLNKKILPIPEIHKDELHEEQLDPESLEWRLALIWSKLLEIEVSLLHRKSDFFAIGGHSLLAMRLISLIRSEYGIDFSIRSVFQQSKLYEMARSLQELRLQTLKIPELEPSVRGDVSPLSYAQQRLWFIQQLLGDSAVYNIPMQIRLNGFLNVKALRKSI